MDGYNADWEGTISVDLNHHQVTALYDMMEQYRAIPASELPDEGKPVEFDVLQEIEDEVKQSISEHKYPEDHD